MFSFRILNNKEYMSYDDYVFDGEKWVSAREYQELLELIVDDSEINNEEEVKQVGKQE